MNFDWKEILKFLSGAFFVTAGASWYFAFYQIAVPFFNTKMSPESLWVRGSIHFLLFLVSFYFGFIKKPKK